jgi:hypothetical protein
MCIMPKVDFLVPYKIPERCAEFYECLEYEI